MLIIKFWVWWLGFVRWHILCMRLFHALLHTKIGTFIFLAVDSYNNNHFPYWVRSIYRRNEDRWISDSTSNFDGRIPCRTTVCTVSTSFQTCFLFLVIWLPRLQDRTAVAETVLKLSKMNPACMKADLDSILLRFFPFAILIELNAV